MSGKVPGHGLFYGWWIAVAAASIEFVVGGVFAQAYGAYVVALRSEFGWSATMLSLGFALVRVESGLLGPLQGWLVDRHGSRGVVSIGLCGMAIGLLLFSQVRSADMFFASVLFIAVGASLAGWVSLAAAVVTWFERRRSTALAIAFLGVYASPFVLPAVVASFSLVGWRTTAAFSAIAVLGIALPIAQLLRRSPARHATGETGVHGSGEPTPPLTAPHAFTLRDALAAPQFWYLSFGHASAMLVVSAVLVHLIPHLNGALALSLSEASAFAVALSVLTIVGAVLGGLVGDRFSRRSLLVLCMGGHSVGLLLLASATSVWMVGAFAALHGLAWGVRGPLISAIRADLFGRTSYGAITGMSSVIVMLGSMAGPLVAGVTFDATGSYRLGFSILAGLAALGALLFVLASPAVGPVATVEPRHP